MAIAIAETMMQGARHNVDSTTIRAHVSAAQKWVINECDKSFLYVLFNVAAQYRILVYATLFDY